MAIKDTKEEVENEEPVQSEKEAEESFAAGFKSVDGDEGPEQKEKAEKLSAAPEPEVNADEPEPDSEAAPATAAQTVDEDQMRLNKRMRDLEGRFGGMAQQFEQLFAKAEAATKDAETPDEQQIAAARKSSEKFEALKEEFPEWGEAIEEQFKMLEASLASAKQPVFDIDSLKADLREEIKEDLQRQRELDRLESKHPDWEATVNTQKFLEWSLDGGPSIDAYREYKTVEMSGDQDAASRAAEFVNEWVREYPEWWGNRGAKIFSPRASDASALLDQFVGKQPEDDKKAEEDTAKREKQERRLKGAVPTKGAGSQPRTAMTEEEAFSRGFNRAHGR